MHESLSNNESEICESVHSQQCNMHILADCMNVDSSWIAPSKEDQAIETQTLPNLDLKKK